nr:uncharacterized protein LOC129386641 [Dermacentor andersoni]
MPALLWAKFCHLFSPGLGLAKGIQHKVKIKSSASPVAQKLRRLPLSLRKPVSDQLERLLSDDVIERVNASEWVSPIVVVRKKDDSIRLCVDLREPNKAIVVDSFPLPHTEELLHSLNGARHFSKLDLASAYYQVLLHPDSRDLTAFITHDGLFRFKRVCFGLASAPAAFHHLMTTVLQGCKGVLCYLDDIIIFGKTEKEHLRNLEQVLQRISEAGLKLNEKCVFNASEIPFLGHRVSSEGIAPLQAKVDAIVHAATPTDTSMLRSFLGLVEYYAKFIPHLAEEVEPMRRLLRKDVHFEWYDAAEKSFARMRLLMAWEQYYNRLTPTHSDCCIRIPNSDRNGAEVLSGRAGGPGVSVGMREMAHLSLGAAIHVVQYRRGEYNKVADALSRLPVPDTEDGLQIEEEVVSLVTSSVHVNDLRLATAEDCKLQEVVHFVQTSWPAKKSLTAELTPYYEVREELSVADGLLMRSERIVVPAKLTATFIQLAHESHPGIVKTKQRLREKYWWPGLDKQVETAIRKCTVCQSADKSAKSYPTPLQPVALPDKPWSKIAIDIVGPFERAPADCRFVISVVDYFSKWPEVAFCRDVSSAKVMDFLLSIFAREGYPDELVSDHGPQFTSREFESFLQDRGIKHSFSAVYHPQANGQVERFNRALKSYIQLALLEQRPVKKTVTEYLGIFRVTPHSTTGLSPAVLLYFRHIRTSLDVIGHPTSSFFTDPAPEMSSLRKRVKEHQRKNKVYADRRSAARVPQFQVGKYVRVKKPTPGPKGTPSFGPPMKILKRIGRWSFCLEDGRTWNASQLTAVPMGASPQHAVRWDDDYQTAPLHGAQASSLPSPRTPGRTSGQLELSPSISSDLSQPQASLFQKMVTVLPLSLKLLASRQRFVGPQETEDHRQGCRTMCLDINIDWLVNMSVLRKG